MKILFLSYYLDSKNNVGAIRPSKFIKYLKKKDHKLFIFSSEKVNIECEKLYVKTAKSRGGSTFYKNIYDKSLLHQLINRLKILIKDLLFSPDKQIWWNIKHLPAMIRIIKRYDIDIAYATGSPFSTFISLNLLKKFCSIPIIIDFRDPWKDSITLKKQSFFRKFIVKFWEKRCVRNADGIIAVNDAIAKQLDEYNPEGKIVTITNGFDPDDFVTNAHIAKNDDFVFLYTGKYSINREDYNPETVFKAFKRFKELNPNKSILRFVGPTDHDTLEYSRKYETDGVICESAKPKKEIINIQKAADAFLQFQYPHNYDDVIPMKIYEYAYQKKIILSFNIKKGILFDFLKDNGFGFTASSHDLDEMATLFKQACNNSLNFSQNSDIAILNKYNYKTLTLKLFKLFKAVL